MLFNRNRLILTFIIGFVLSSSVYGKPMYYYSIDFNNLNLSPLGENPRNINLVSYDYSASSINSTLASNIMSGLFTGVEPVGTYSIKLSFEKISSKYEIGISGIPGLMGVPVETHTYRLTAKISIYDSEKNHVYSVSKNDLYRTSYWIYDLYKITNWRNKQISEIYSRLIRQCKNDLSGNAQAINNKLIAAAQPFNKTFEKLTKDLPNRARIAVLPLNGCSVQAPIIFGEISNYLHNKSDKNRVLIDRNNMEALIAELERQGSLLYDQNFVATLGRMVGANILIVGEVWCTNSNEHQLNIQALEVETSKILGFEILTY